MSSGEQLSITSTVIGEPVGSVLRRSGARVGDGVFVTGPLGGAAAGWRLLSAKIDDAAASACIAKWRRPRPRFDLVAELSDIATAAIDISDGIDADLRHLLRASEVGADLPVADLPMLEGLAEQAARGRQRRRGSSR